MPQKVTLAQWRFIVGVTVALLSVAAALGYTAFESWEGIALCVVVGIPGALLSSTVASVFFVKPE